MNQEEKKDAKILSSSNRLIVEEPVDKEQDDKTVRISQLKAKELGCSRGSTVKLIGKMKNWTVAAVQYDKTVDDSKIRIGSDLRTNLRIKLGEIVGVEVLSAVPKIQRIRVLPFADTIEGITGKLIDILTNYFESGDWPFRKGDIFSITEGVKRLEFKVMDCGGQDYGIANKTTEINTDGAPLQRSDEEKLNFTGYSGVGGCSKVLKEIRETIELPLRHPALFRSLGVKPPRAVLLSGPSGCGKSLIVHALAKETGATLKVIRGPEIISKMAGEAESRLKKIFEEAEKKVPAIIFIDEIDAIAPRREGPTSEIERRLIAQLASLIDGDLGPDNSVNRQDQNKIVIIAATNRPAAIDPTLRKFGRFDREIEMGVPNPEGREEILQIHTKSMKLAEDVELKQVAKDTHGFVGADISQLCTEAALHCIREKLDTIDVEADTIPAEVLSSMKVTSAHFRAALKKVRPSSLRERVIQIPNVKWEDIGGYDDVKRNLQEMILLPMEHPKIFEKFNMTPSKGVLFYGPPGCGKTLFAKAVANECSANFISIKGPELLTVWFGESEANVRAVFDKARAAAPCILFFDELDSIAVARGSRNSDGGVTDRVINQLLTEMDGFGEKRAVFFIGATNRPELLDEALIRPGRLDQLIYIPLPDSKTRKLILQANLSKAPLAKDVNIDALVAITEMFSGADLTELCQRAAKAAIKDTVQAEKRNTVKKEIDPEAEIVDYVPEITRAHFEEAFKNARKSVASDDLEKFNAFKIKYSLDSTKMKINWENPVDPSKQDDDIYT